MFRAVYPIILAPQEEIDNTIHRQVRTIVREKLMSEGQAGLAVKPQVNNQGLLRLLILEESAPAAQLLIDPLHEAGYAVTAARVKSALEFQAALKKQEWDLIFSPPTLANFSAKQALALLSHAKMDTPCIIISDDYTDEVYTQVLNWGARALVKRNNFEQLLLATQRELRDLAMRRGRHYYEKMFRQSERRCQILLESSPKAIACVRNGKVIYSNPSFDSLIIKRKERGGSGNIIDLIHPDNKQAFEQLIKGIETGKNLSDKIDLCILDENDKPQGAKVEAIVAHINELQCAQVSISLNTEPENTTSHVSTSAPKEVVEKASNQNTAIQKSDTNIASENDDNPALQQQLKDALTNGRFKLLYQPIVPLRAQPAEIYEVLIRMIDENGEEISPASFMPVAEKAGLMPEIDRWVIQTSMETLVKQHGDNNQTSLLVKLSEASLCDQDLIPWLNERLSEFHLPGDTLIFELKDTYVVNHSEAAKQLIQGLKQSHCRITLGHFGADPHSLDHLEQLRVDFVKLAGSFIDNLSDDPKSQAMIKAVVQTAHDFGTLTVATFVQDASNMATLWQCNVDYIQGYFLQAPDQDMSYNFSEQED